MAPLRIIVGLTAAVLLAAVIPAAGAPAAGSAIHLAANSTSAGEPAANHSITLITGDRVDLAANGLPAVTPGPGRRTVPFRITTHNGRVRVVPLDAAGLIAQGRLDPRLFDVTALTEAGYDDARQADLPLILQFAHGQSAAPVTPGGRFGRRLPSLNASAVAQSKKELSAFWNTVTRGDRAGVRSLAPGLHRLWLNGRLRLTLDRSTAQIGAPAAWQAGWTGAGVDVAVLDSGIDAGHPDLAGRITAAANFTTEPAGDAVGHGTHVASIVAGSGNASGGTYRGVAPGANLLDGKVCTLDGCWEDAVLAGMEWAAAQRRAPVVSMSLGGWDTPGVDLLEQAVNDLSAQYGTLFVIAAGNGGPLATSIDSPASADAALAVGAVDRQDRVAEFSGRGPRTGDGGLKPEITAPGVGIVAARGTGTLLGEPVGDAYVALDGTSMATPHVAAAAAILRQQHPEWTGAQLKAALMGSATPSADGGVFDQGAGRVDLARATTQQVTASPASLGYGTVRWPHTDDVPLTQTVTYRNGGSADLTLDLHIQATGPGGPAPAGLFTAGSPRVVIPAGGTGTVTLTADTRPDGVPVGSFTGRLVATDGTTTVVTPLAVEKEPERYDVTLRHIGRDGQAPQVHVSYLDRIGDCGDDPACGSFSYGSAATSVLRLPPGRYVLGDFSVTAGRNDLTLLLQPVLDLHADVSVTLDARTAGAVVMTAPRSSARMMTHAVKVARELDRPMTSLAYTMGDDPAQSLYTGALGAATPDADDLVAIAEGRFAEPGADGDFRDSPYEYNLAAYTLGRLFTGMRLRPAQREFATVEATYAAITPQRRILTTSHSAVPLAGPEDLSFPPGGGPELVSSRLPARRTQYFQAAGVSWWSSMIQRDPVSGGAGLFEGMDEPQAYRAGQTYQSRWGHGVFGPAFGHPRWYANNLARGVMRKGDRLAVGIMNFVDGDPGHVNDPRIAPGRVRLLRDGEVVQDWGRGGYLATQLPPEAAVYRLEATVEQDMSPLSSSISSAWTFRSGHVDGPDAAALPLMTVRYAPRLDDHNRAPAVRGYVIPVQVHRQPGAAPAAVTGLTVEVSYDSGVTWRVATVAALGDGWAVTVDNRAGTSVSLRAVATDAAGGQVEQTILNAYAIKA